MQLLKTREVKFEKKDKKRFKDRCVDIFAELRGNRTKISLKQIDDINKQIEPVAVRREHLGPYVVVAGGAGDILAIGAECVLAEIGISQDQGIHRAGLEALDQSGKDAAGSNSRIRDDQLGVDGVGC